MSSSHRVRVPPAGETKEERGLLEIFTVATLTIKCKSTVDSGVLNVGTNNRAVSVVVSF